MDCSQASLSLTISPNLPKFMSIESVTLSNHLTLCYPLLLLPSIFPSITFFPSESALCIRWPEYWSFSFSIGPSNEYSGLIPLGWTGLILLSIVWCINVFPTNRHPCTLEWISLTSFVMFGGMPHWWQDLSSQTRDRTQKLLQWKLQVLITALPGNSLKVLSRLAIKHFVSAKC